VAAWTDSDADRVVEAWRAVCFRVRSQCRFVDLILRLVQLETNLGQVVEFGDSVACYLSLNASFKDTVEQSVDMGLFGEVDE